MKCLRIGQWGWWCPRSQSVLFQVVGLLSISVQNSKPLNAMLVITVSQSLSWPINISQRFAYRVAACLAFLKALAASWSQNHPGYLHSLHALSPLLDILHSLHLDLAKDFSWAGLANLLFPVLPLYVIQISIILLRIKFCFSTCSFVHVCFLLKLSDSSLYLQKYLSL